MADISELLKKPAEWLSSDGDESEIVLSSRVRLARNLENRPFSHVAEPELLAEMSREVKEAVLRTDMLGKATIVDMDDISEGERMILAERRLISEEMVRNYSNRSLAVKEGEKLSIMINEEDHLRIQSFESGLSVRKAFKRIGDLDDELDERLDFAFSKRLGYLTACTTNVGTGLRVSAMVHLPGLVHNNDIRGVIDGLRHVRLTVRGSYGEGSEVVGNFFQISNSITLGLSEADTVTNIDSHIRKVIEFEKKARTSLLREARTLLEDKIWRSYGILKSARLVTSKETMSLISAIRLGIGLGIITDIKLADLNEILIIIQPMHLQRLYGKALGPEERDRIRADHIRSRLKKD
ncbi:MAG: protein arginine kinase [Candidatus Krumholzibacteriota bacterium]|nr:protein arginine kinase [Candidatus Krumholzibacteriota bacterium]